VSARLYIIPASHPSITAELMLEHKGIPYKRTDLLPVVSKGALRAVGFPGVTVPALKIEGHKVQGSRQIARELEARRVQLLGMKRRRRGQVCEQRLEAVDGFEPQEVGDLGDAAGPRLGQSLRQGIAALMQQAVNVAQHAGERGVSAAVEHRGDVGVIQQDAVVGAPLGDTDHAESAVRRGDVGLLKELQTHSPDLDQRRAVERRVAVFHLEFAGAIAGKATHARPVEVRLVDAGLAYGQGEDDY